MQTTLLWKGTAYDSLENCSIITTEHGVEINSVIIGQHEQIIYKVDYQIKTTQNWETKFVNIKTQLNNQIHSLSLEGNGQGNWLMNGKMAEQFAGCMDVDIALSPFTNTLPINRLKLEDHESHPISVIYLDLLALETKPLFQKYTKITPTAYHYENVPNDFEATIQVDESGFVVDYPGLFARTAFFCQ